MVLKTAAGGLLASLLLAQALSAQTVTFLQGDWAKSGVVIVPYDPSPAFLVAARASAPGILSQSAIDISSLLPYSFILRNTSVRTIIAYSARWATTDADGQVRTRDMMSEDIKRQSGKNVIEPASDRLMMPIQQFMPSNPLGIARFSAFVDNTRKLFTSQAKIEVSLEAVIVDNGVALGRDAGNSIPGITSLIDAQREIFTGIITAEQQNGQSAVITYLQNLADGPQDSLIAASRQATPDLAYADFFSIHLVDYARTYLRLARQNFGGLMSLAEERMRQPRFVIHR